MVPNLAEEGGSKFQLGRGPSVAAYQMLSAAIQAQNAIMRESHQNRQRYLFRNVARMV